MRKVSTFVSTLESCHRRRADAKLPTYAIRRNTILYEEKQLESFGDHDLLSFREYLAVNLFPGGHICGRKSLEQELVEFAKMLRR